MAFWNTTRDSKSVEEALAHPSSAHHGLRPERDELPRTGPNQSDAAAPRRWHPTMPERSREATGPLQHYSRYVAMATMMVSFSRARFHDGRHASANSERCGVAMETPDPLRGPHSVV